MQWLARLAAESHRSTEQQLLQLHAPQLMLTWWNMCTPMYTSDFMSDSPQARGSLNAEQCRWALWAFQWKEILEANDTQLMSFVVVINET